MEAVTILLPTDLLERLTSEAEERGVTVAELGGLVVAAWWRTRSDEIVLSDVDQFRDQ
jgi:hypothetical protein